MKVTIMANPYSFFFLKNFNSLGFVGFCFLPTPSPNTAIAGPVARAESPLARSGGVDIKNQPIKLCGKNSNSN